MSKKNKAAQALAAIRWAKKTKEEKSAYGKMMAEAKKAKRKCLKPD